MVSNKNSARGAETESGAEDAPEPGWGAASEAWFLSYDSALPAQDPTTQHLLPLSLIQDVLLKAYPNLRKLDDPARFAPWLYRVAHNEAYSLFRKRRPEGETEELHPETLEGAVFPAVSGALRQAHRPITRRPSEFRSSTMKAEAGDESRSATRSSKSDSGS